MAAKHRKQNGPGCSFSWQFYRPYMNYEYFKSLLVSPAKLFPVACALVILEVVINLIVINYVKYTEIDWKSYMQEVEGVLNGTFDYSLLKGKNIFFLFLLGSLLCSLNVAFYFNLGDTGPLVYPAGFVWVYSGLYFVTGKGENIRLGQYIFGSLYIFNLILVLRIYLKAKKLPPYVLILSCLTSYRIHSIFSLRLFNDPVAVIFFYISLNLFLDSKWSLGSFFFSLAVSVKMNILLFAPALLLTYLNCLGLMQTIQQLAVCAGLQILLALPFLLDHPINYLLGAFNLGRVFLYEWTVNWRFLPEHFFIDRRFHFGLLVLHIFLLAIFYKYCSLHLRSYAKLKEIEKDIKPQLKKNTSFNMNTSSQLFLLPMFLSNFIGIACSRSLHYQFYIWYFHSLPFLIWSTHYSTSMKLSFLGIIEMCWNTFPSTPFSSFALHCCHIAVLFGIYKTQSKLYNHISSSKKK